MGYSLFFFPIISLLFPLFLSNHLITYKTNSIPAVIFDIEKEEIKMGRVLCSEENDYCEPVLPPKFTICPKYIYNIITDDGKNSTDEFENTILLKKKNKESFYVTFKENKKVINKSCIKILFYINFIN